MLQRRQLREAALIALTVFLLRIGVSWARHIDEDCIVFQRKQINVPGSSLNITSWNDSPGEQEFLALDLHFYGKEFPETYSILYVFPSKFELLDFNNGEVNKKSFPINPPSPNGWVDLQLKFEEKLEVWIAGFPGPQVREQNDFHVEKVKLKGSNTTVNCRDDMVVWRVNHTRQVIPVAGAGSYRLIMYSGSPFTPKFISAEGELSLGLEGEAYGTGEGMPPLPPYRDHNFTLKCNHSDSRVNSCYLQAPGSDVIGPLVCSEIDCSITVLTRHGYFFLLLIRETVTNAEESKGAFEDSSEVATTVILSAIILSGFIGFAVCYAVHKMKKWAVYNEYKEDEAPLLQVKSRMWDAVNSNDVQLAKYLLENGVDPNAREGEQPTTALMEAHILGRTEIVKLFLSNSGEKLTPPPNPLVKEMMTKLRKRMKEVFAAARNGMYDRKEGVHVKLKAHHFPATIRDHKGRSLVHCIANAKFDDERPCWEAADIRAFFDQEKPFPNAIDHWGQTALHVVAGITPRAPGARVVWGGMTRTVAEAWLEVARLLVEIGCDPRIKDHQGQIATNIARGNNNLKLADFFENESKTRREIDRKLVKSKFPDLVRAAREGNTSRMMQLLMENVPTLPMAAEEDPLKEALRYRRRDAVFLLLAAGAPLCNQYVSHPSVLEISHHMVGQPALFPAIMRKAYVDRLADEEERAKNLPLASFINKLKSQVMEMGDEAHPTFEGDLAAKTDEAKKLLLEAAGLGLSLTCQMLSQEDLCFHRISREETPLEKALQAYHHNTAYALCRDLWLTPYICQNVENAPTELIDDLKERDLVIFELVCEDKKSTYGKELCDQIKTSVSEGAPIEEEILDLVLYWMAENGLTALLHERISDLDVNRRISNCTKSTMMHVAALSGHRNVVEYLRYNDASFLETIGGFKVKDLAAMRKCKNCLMYICMLEHESHSWLPEYDKLKDFYKVSNVELQVFEFPRKDVLSALSEPFSEDQAYELLRKKGDMLKIRTFADLLLIAENTNDQKYIKFFSEKVQEELDAILDKIRMKDSRFAGKLSLAGALADGYEVSSFDTVDANLEIESTEANSKDLNITIKEDGKGLDIETAPSDFLNPQNFTKAFMSLMEKVVEEHTSSQRKQGLVLVPPFLLPSKDGAYLFWMWQREKNVRFFRMNIRPVVEVKAPEHLERNLFKKRNTSKSVAATIFICLMNVRRYLYSSYTPTKLMMESLSNEERKTMYLCRFLTKMISFPWLYQRIKIHPLSSPWQKPKRIAGLKTRVLDSLFLEELNETAQSDFKPGNIQERVRSILQRGTEKDSDGILVAKKEIRHLYNPSLRIYNTSQSVEGIIRYLDQLV